MTDAGNNIASRSRRAEGAPSGKSCQWSPPRRPTTLVWCTSANGRIPRRVSRKRCRRAQRGRAQGGGPRPEVLRGTVALTCCRLGTGWAGPSGSAREMTGRRLWRGTGVRPPRDQRKEHWRCHVRVGGSGVGGEDARGGGRNRRVARGCGGGPTPRESGPRGLADEAGSGGGVGPLPRENAPRRHYTGEASSGGGGRPMPWVRRERQAHAVGERAATPLGRRGQQGQGPHAAEERAAGPVSRRGRPASRWWGLARCPASQLGRDGAAVSGGARRAAKPHGWGVS